MIANAIPAGHQTGKMLPARRENSDKYRR